MAGSNAYTLKIGGTTTRSVWNISMADPPLVPQATLEQIIGTAHLILPKVLLRLCLWLLSSSSSLVISGLRLGLSRTPANGAIKLWPCNSLACKILSCHWFKYLMVMTRVTLVLTR